MFRATNGAFLLTLSEHLSFLTQWGKYLHAHKLKPLKQLIEYFGAIIDRVRYGHKII